MSYLTEEEARKKWCPQARPYSSLACMGKIEGLFNRDDYGVPLSISCCVASKCMMWRWDADPSQGFTKGFCGLGGKP